jgi:hypothetical protein
MAEPVVGYYECDTKQLFLVLHASKIGTECDNKRCMNMASYHVYMNGAKYFCKQCTYLYLAAFSAVRVMNAPQTNK